MNFISFFSFLKPSKNSYFSKIQLSHLSLCCLAGVIIELEVPHELAADGLPPGLVHGVDRGLLNLLLQGLRLFLFLFRDRLKIFILFEARKTFLLFYRFVNLKIQLFSHKLEPFKGQGKKPIAFYQSKFIQELFFRFLSICSYFVPSLRRFLDWPLGQFQQCWAPPKHRWVWLLKISIFI